MTTLRHIFRAVLAAGLGVTGLVVATAAGADAATVACQRTYSNTMDFAIPDDSNVTSTIDVDENGLVVSDVDLSLDIDHTYDGDLEIWLYSRTDTSTTRHTARMINRDGDGSDNFTGTVLDDEASTPVSWGSPPFTGRFQPNQKLSAFDGEVGGRYSLFAADRQSGDTGTPQGLVAHLQPTPAATSTPMVSRTTPTSAWASRHTRRPGARSPRARGRRSTRVGSSAERWPRRSADARPDAS